MKRKELSNTREFVRFWFNFKGFIMKPDGSFDGDRADLFGSMWLDYKEILLADNVKSSPFDKKTGKKIKRPILIEKDMEKAWKEFRLLEKEHSKQKIIDCLVFRQSEEAGLKNWMKAVVGNYSEFELAVMKHFLWQVKRKLMNKPVVYNLAPCLWGIQGSGKTTAIQLLLEPVQHLTAEWSPLEAVDQRNTQNLSDNYVCFFDEMAGLQRVEIESLKRIISAAYTTYRPMYTNQQIKVKQNCTFIGVSNKALTENIYDPTGLRRFVEIKCIDLVDWKLINKIKAIDIWTSIDENNERGYIEDFKAEMKIHQDELTIMDEVQHFVKEMSVWAPDGDVKEITASDLWNKYFTWRSTNGYSSKPALALNSFCMKLRTHGLNKRSKRIDGKEKTVYSVNAKSYIFEGPIALVKKLEFNNE